MREAPVVRNLVACAGASTCRLGICLSRGLAKAVRHELTAIEPILDRVGDLSIHISGCPNSCGRHPIGNLGFSGAARKVDGNLVPYYAVQLGGRVGEGRTRFARSLAAVPTAAAGLECGLLQGLEATKPTPLTSIGSWTTAAVSWPEPDLWPTTQEVPPLAHRKEFYYDWDATQPFSLAGRGAGECSAGVST